MTDPREPLTLDVGAGVRLAIRRWRRIAAGVVFGLACSAATLLFWPASFTGSALLLIKEFPGAQAQVQNKLNQLSQLVPNLIGGDQGDQELATELALLQSRSAIGTVVDSLRLEIRPRSPSRTPPALLVDSVTLPQIFKPVKLTLAAGANTGPQGTVFASPKGANARVKLVDREDAISDVADHLTVSPVGGDVVKIVYTGRDSITAAQVPNHLVRVYMASRSTVDRGLDQRRLEFLSARADTIRRDLRLGVDSLARLQERSGVGVDAAIAARGIADQFATIQGQMAQLRASLHAMDSLVALVRSGHADPRSLAGFPDLLRSPAINDLIASMAQLETQRTLLLGHAAPTAPQVVALARARDSLAAQLLPMATAYRQATARQLQSLTADADSLDTQLVRLPGREAAVAKQQAQVTQLAQLDAGMGAQVLQARLAAMAEGGDVRLVDAAVTPRRVSFPRPLPTWLVGLFGGLAIGLLLVPIGAPPPRQP